MIRLYSIPISSYSAKVRIVLRAKGLAFEDAAPPGGYSSTDYARLVPSATMPAIDHDGLIVWDSEAINEYLEEVCPDPPMLPAEPANRAAARSLSRFHDTRLEPNIRALFSQIAPGSRDLDAVERGVAQIEQRLNQLSAILGKVPFPAGERLMISDCGYAISFVVLDALRDGIGFCLDIPGEVVAYRDRIFNHEPVAEEIALYRKTIGEWARDRGK